MLAFPINPAPFSSRWNGRIIEPAGELMTVRKPARKDRKTSGEQTKAALAAENAALRAELVEAREQQAATAEIFGVISREPIDVQPVFDAIVRQAVGLCRGFGGILVRYDGQQLHVVAHDNLQPDGEERLRRSFPRPPDRSSLPGLAILDRTIIHVPDLQASAITVLPAREAGLGSSIAVPLLRDGQALGALTVSLQETGGFSDRHIAVLRTFADQAVPSPSRTPGCSRSSEPRNRRSHRGPRAAIPRPPKILRVIS